MAKNVKGFSSEKPVASFPLMSNVLREPKLDLAQLLIDLEHCSIFSELHVRCVHTAIDNCLLRGDSSNSACRLGTCLATVAELFGSDPGRCNNNRMPRDVLNEFEWEALVRLGSVPDPDHDLIARVCQFFCLEDRKDFAALIRETFRQLHARSQPRKQEQIVTPRQ